MSMRTKGYAPNLTPSPFYVSLFRLQPKSVCLPAGRCGRPKFRETGRGERDRATGSKATFKAKPDS